MVSFVFAIVLLGLSVLGITLRKIYYYLPGQELKRQAEGGDKLARVLWQAVAYGSSLRVLLWLWIGLSAAGGFVLLARVAPWFIAFLAIALLLWMDFAWFPRRHKVSGAEAKLSVIVTPVIVRLLNYLHPVFDRLAGMLGQHESQGGHTNLFETSDLLDLVDKQVSQADNRIDPQELDRVKRVLQAHNYKISDVLTPRSEVKSVSDSDTVGLVLLDELHASGQSSFPVRKGSTDKIIGTLYLRDLNLKTEGLVHDYMVKDVRYAHEDDSLAQALQAFFKTRHQLFVVVNSFEEYVGVVTLENILRQVAGEFSEDGFDQHHDLAAVAARHSKPEEVVETEPEVVEQPEPNAEEAPEVNPAEAVEESVQVPEPIEAEPEPVEEAEDFAEVEVVDEQESNDPGELAALDLPDEKDQELSEGSHVTFEKPKTKKSKPSAKKSEE